jgi:hypothetical protein
MIYRHANTVLQRRSNDCSAQHCSAKCEWRNIHYAVICDSILMTKEAPVSKLHRGEHFSQSASGVQASSLLADY